MAKYAWQEQSYHLNDEEQAFVDNQNKKYNQSDKKPSRQKVSDGTAKYQKDFTPKELDQRRAEAKERAESHINKGGTYEREDGSNVDISTAGPANVEFGPPKNKKSDTQSTAASTNPASTNPATSQSEPEQKSYFEQNRENRTFNPFEMMGVNQYYS